MQEMESLIAIDSNLLLTNVYVNSLYELNANKFRRLWNKDHKNHVPQFVTYRVIQIMFYYPNNSLKKLSEYSYINRILNLFSLIIQTKLKKIILQNQWNKFKNIKNIS